MVVNPFIDPVPAWRMSCCPVAFVQLRVCFPCLRAFYRGACTIPCPHAVAPVELGGFSGARIPLFCSAIGHSAIGIAVFLCRMVGRSATVHSDNNGGAQPSCSPPTAASTANSDSASPSADESPC